MQLISARLVSGPVGYESRSEPEHDALDRVSSSVDQFGKTSQTHYDSKAE